MRSSKILICSILWLLLILSHEGRSQPWSLRSGIYLFTDITASEFYYFAPTFLAGYDAWKRSRLSLTVTTGLSYNGVKYNSHLHHLFMVPLMTTISYDFPNPGSMVWPVTGMGLSILGKADVNRDLDFVNYSLAYGFHAGGGLRFMLKNTVLTLDLAYQLLIPPVPEDLNLNGVLVTAGIRLPAITSSGRHE